MATLERRVEALEQAGDGLEFIWLRWDGPETRRVISAQHGDERIIRCDDESEDEFRSRVKARVLEHRPRGSRVPMVFLDEADEAA